MITVTAGMRVSTLYKVNEAYVTLNIV